MKPIKLNLEQASREFAASKETLRRALQRWVDDAPTIIRDQLPKPRRSK